MKRKVFILLICFIFIIIFTQKTYGDVIKVPNRSGDVDIYEDVEDFEELYNILEDLSIDYESLLEEYNSLENSYEELERKVELELEEKELLNQDIKRYTNKNEDNNKLLIVFTIILLAIIAIATGKEILKKDKK